MLAGTPRTPLDKRPSKKLGEGGRRRRRASIKRSTKAGCAWNAKKEKCADCAKQKNASKCKKAGCKWKKSKEKCLAKK